MLLLKWLIFNTNGKPEFTAITYTAHMLTCILNIVPLLLSLHYFDLHMNSNKKFLQARKKIYLILFSVFSIYALSNIWTGFIFIMDEAGTIIDQKGAFVHIFVQVGSLATYGIFNYKSFVRCVSKAMSLYIAFALMPFVGGIFQAFFPNVPAVWSMFALITLYMFVFLVREDTRRDALTGVYSRGQFEEYLRRKLSKKRSFSIALADIDEFKQVNDNFGHSEGDELLILFTQIIMESLRSTDMIARIGGDEFVIIIESNEVASGVMILNRLKNEVDHYNRNGDKPYQIKFSTGLYYVENPQTHNSQDIIKIIDQLMYEEKSKHHRKSKAKLNTI